MPKELAAVARGQVSPFDVSVPRPATCYSILRLVGRLIRGARARLGVSGVV